MFYFISSLEYIYTMSIEQNDIILHYLVYDILKIGRYIFELNSQFGHINAGGKMTEETRNRIKNFINSLPPETNDYITIKYTEKDVRRKGIFGDYTYVSLKIQLNIKKDLDILLGLFRIYFPSGFIS